MSVDETERAAAEPTQASPRPTWERIPALDGVRAIAIVAVLLFHNYFFTSSNAWRGGFLGVDMFFVLSGFLITTLLLVEHRATGRIDVRRFWSRRARRLLPALFVMIIGDAVLARYVFDPFTASQLRWDGIGSLLYFENWRLAVGSGSALGHTWSLSVEEQWYLIWPVLFGVLLAVSRGRVRRLAGSIVVLAAASAVECALLFRRVPIVAVSARAFYGTDTRAQSLLVGAALAVVLANVRHRASRFLQTGGWIAIALLAWAIVSSRDGDPLLYHGGFLVVALVTATLIAAVVAAPDAALARLLSTRPLVAIGVTSYGLYLYHLPIYHWITSDSTHFHGLALLALRLGVTAAFAAASYRWVERPFRRGARLDRTRLVALAVGGAVALGATIVATPAGPPQPDLAAYALSIAARHTPEGVHRVLAAGDSSALVLELRTGGIFDNNTVRGAAYGLKGCDLLAGQSATAANQQSPPACTSRFSKLAGATHAFSPDFAALMIGESEASDRVAGTKTIRFGSAPFRALLVAAVDRARTSLTSTGARLIVLPLQCESGSNANGPAIRWFNDALATYARRHRDARFVHSGDLDHCAEFSWAELAAALAH